MPPRQRRPGGPWVVEDLDFGDADALEDHVARHGVRLVELVEVKEDEPKLMKDRESHLIVGRTDGGRLLAIRVRHLARGVWRVKTAYDASAEERTKYEGK